MWAGSAEERHALANSLLVESVPATRTHTTTTAQSIHPFGRLSSFGPRAAGRRRYTNTFDYWYGHGATASTHGGLLTDVDAMLTMTQLNYSVPGSWNDADMLQIWSATQPSFLLWGTVHPLTFSC